MEGKNDFMSRVIGAASQGAVGAVIAASLSAVAEPVANRVQTKRIPLAQALQEVDIEACKKYFSTTVTTNFIKFPLFEATNVAMSTVDLPPAVRGMATGAVFTTLTLPITNYRFMKSLGQEVDFGALYKAYLPTVGRDIIYGMVRNQVVAVMNSSFPELAKSAFGRFIITFVQVATACIISSPMNDLRGYYLTPPEKRQPMKTYFTLEKFLRATAIGTSIMSLSIACGSLATGPVERQLKMIKAISMNEPTFGLLILLFIIHQILSGQRKTEVLVALEKLKKREKADAA